VGLLIITEPSVEPISLDEAKLHLKQDDIDDDDESIIENLAEARTAAENYLSRSLISQTWRQTFCNWRLVLERPPHRSISAVRYVDYDGATQTIASTEYQADLSGDQPARIVPAYGRVWPDFRTETLNPVTVEFVAGYGDSGASVPPPIRSAIKLMLTHLYMHRGDESVELPQSIRFLLDPYRALYA
jgi:uncharacterized phiE125 gp8 family phage protein